MAKIEKEAGKTGFRDEHDSLGNVQVPDSAYYGAQTARARLNFPISGLLPHPALIIASVQVKKAAAQTNLALGLLDPGKAKAIIAATDEISAGALHDHFVVDPFQAGAGTSHNMNTNEVVANRAIEILGGERGDYKLVHPNDDVNMAQSTNDVFPTAMRLATLAQLERLYPVLTDLAASFHAKGKEFDGIIKSGRTHLQDAVPIRLGQEFEAYALSIDDGIRRLRYAATQFGVLNIGATAAGTGLNSHPDYQEGVVRRLREYTGFDLKPAPHLVYYTETMTPAAEVSSALKNLVIDLTRIANDLRLMSSGPRTGFGEINLPPVQPGSSIMPGKVNPVMAEVLNMVAYQVIGNDLTVTMAAQAGQLELNVMMPVIAHNLLGSTEILINCARVFREFCVDGITANAERCAELVENSLGLATALNPWIGYEAAAKVAQESNRTGKPVRQIVQEKNLLSPEDLVRVLDTRALTEPGVPGKTGRKQEENTK